MSINPFQPTKFELENNPKIWLNPRAKKLMDANAAPKSYFLSKGAVFKHAKSRDPTEGRLYLPNNLLPFALAFYHFNSHVGSDALLHQLRFDYFSPFMQKLARKFTSACHLCNYFKADHSAKTPLGLLPLPPAKNHTWEADIVEGLPSVQGFNA